MRHSPKRRYTARDRPHRRQRLYARVLYFGVRAWRTRWEVLAIVSYVLAGGRRAAVLRERHADRLQEGEGLLVGRCRRGDRDVESADLIDLVVVDLREDDLLADPEGIVAAAVEGARVEAAEVADPRDRHRHEAVEELVCALVAQGDGHADRHALADLELGDRLARAADARPLAGDGGQLLDRGIEHLGVLLGLAHAHVDRHLDDLGRLHGTRVAEALDERGTDLLEVPGLQSGGGDSCHMPQSSLAPLRRATRRRLPSCTSTPMRVGLPSLGSSSMTLET